MLTDHEDIRRIRIRRALLDAGEVAEECRDVPEAVERVLGRLRGAEPGPLRHPNVARRFEVRPTDNLKEPPMPLVYEIRDRLTIATIYRRPRQPHAAWFLGIGFDDWLAHLPVADAAPTDAADEALGVAGWRRVGKWVPHHRADWGWLEAHVEQKTDSEH